MWRRASSSRCLGRRAAASRRCSIWSPGWRPASAGGIWSFGDPVETPSPERSLIFQETSLFPWLSVWQNVSFGLSLRGEAVAERKEVARRALARVGLSEAMDKRPDELSGGMRQRVAVARALAMRPKVLLMDEPFAALDVQTRAKMQDFLLDVWQASGASVLFVTHHIEEAIALADRVVVFTARPGRVKMVVPIDLQRPRDLFSPRGGGAATRTDAAAAGRGGSRVRRAGGDWGGVNCGTPSPTLPRCAGEGAQCSPPLAGGGRGAANQGDRSACPHH